MSQRDQMLLCKCGKPVVGMITGFGCLCLECFNKKMKELESEIKAN